MSRDESLKTVLKRDINLIHNNILNYFHNCLNSPKNIHETIDEINNITNINKNLQNNVKLLIEHQLIAEEIDMVKSKLSSCDKEIEKLGKDLSNIEAHLYQESIENKKNKNKNTPNLYQVLLLAERLALMSHSPSSHMKMGMNGFSVTKPPAPQQGGPSGSIDVSRLYRNVDDLYDIIQDDEKLYNFLHTPLTQSFSATVNVHTYSQEGMYLDETEAIPLEEGDANLFTSNDINKNQIDVGQEKEEDDVIKDADEENKEDELLEAPNDWEDDLFI